MSPEQASGQRVDHRADVYALGIIMYEMFTGRVPFVADTYMGVLTQHMFAKPTAPSQVSAAARWLGPLEAIILRTLEKKPEHRYASMADLVADIEKVSSFGGDGALRVAAAGGSSALSRPVFALANALEPAARGEAETAAVTASLIRRRRARARAWVTYGAITLGVAAISIAAARLAQGHRPPAALAAPAVIPASPAASSQTAAPPAPSSAPPAVASPSSAPASSSAPPAPSSARAPAGRPAHPAGSASSKRAQTLPGDFADPWAR
jgi:serine/threonine-protein kinase